MDTDRKLPATRRQSDNDDQSNKFFDNASFILHPYLKRTYSVETIEIVVKRAGQSTLPCLEISIAANATVLELKTVIRDELADESPCLMVPVERQRLLFAGKMLSTNDCKLVEDIKLRKDTTNYIHLAPIPKGQIPTTRTSLENKFGGRSRSRKSRSNHRFRPYSLPTATFAREGSPTNPYFPSQSSNNSNRREIADLSRLSSFSPPTAGMKPLIPLRKMTHLTQTNNNESLSPNSSVFISEETMLLLQSFSACNSNTTRSNCFGPYE